MALGLAAIGVSPILVRYAAEAPPLALAVWRTAFAAGLLAPVAWVRAGAEIRALPRRELGLILGGGVFLGLHFAAWIASLYHTSVASASVLVTSSPLFIALLGWLVLRERLTLKTLAAIGIGVAGAALIGLGDAGEGAFPRAWWGNTLALTAALLVAAYLLVGRAVRQRTSLLAYLLPLYAAAAGTTLAVALLTGTSLAVSPTVLGLCLLMALVPQLIGHTAFNYAVKFLPAALLGLLSLVEPVIASVLALLLFGEAPTALALAGMATVLGAVAVGVRRSA